MKIIWGLAIALVAVFSVSVSANIGPRGFQMIANAGRYSVAISEFVLSDMPQSKEGHVDFYLPDQFSSSAYKGLKCVIAINIGDTSSSTVERIISSVLEDPSGLTRIKQSFDLQSRQLVHTFRNICSFIAPENPRAHGMVTRYSASIGTNSGTNVTKGTEIRPYNHVISGFTAYIAPEYEMKKTTKFRIANIHQAASSSVFVIRNPHFTDATTGSYMIFQSRLSKSHNCTLTRDKVLSKIGAIVTPIDNGGGIRINLDSPLNNSNEILLFCPNIRGVVYSPGVSDKYVGLIPTILEFAYDDANKAYTIASTPSNPGDDPDF